MRLFAIALFCLVSLCACNYWINPHNSRQLTLSPLKTDVRAIAHAMGETTVPLHPQRVVAIHWYAAEVATALGVKLLGIPGPILHYLDPKNIPKDITDIGWPVNIEKVVALKPDLLLGSVGWYQDTYRLWSQIAPTVLDTMKYNGQWKEPFFQIARFLGKTEKAKQIVSQYNARIAEFKTKIGSRLKNMKVSVVSLNPGAINLVTKSSFSGVILEDFGLQRPPSQDLDVNATRKLSNYPVNYVISAELLAKLDGDALFLIASRFNSPLESQRAIGQLQTEPLWSKLKVVQQGKVYGVGEYWLSGSYITANRVIDDLFKYIVED